MLGVTNLITATCKNCSKEFQKYPSSNKMFCSRKCSVEYRSKKVEVVEFVCEQCGKTFTRTKREVKNAKYKGHPIRFCSKKCKSDYWGRNRVEVTCPVCGKKFLQQRRLAHENHCCSPECSAKNPANKMIQGEDINLICPICKKTFTRKLSYIHKTAKKGQKTWCCSKKCADELKTFKEFRTTKVITASPLVEYTCEHCGKTIKSRKPRKYCSNDCRIAHARRNSKELVCVQCGKPFHTNGYDVKRGRKYCSKECLKEARRIERDTYGKLSHYLRSTKAYKDWRKDVCDRANWHCEICGKPIDGDLEVHHNITLYQICKQYDFDLDAILASKEYTDVNNGSCLCLDCHIKKHPYDNKLRNKKGQFCRREFKTARRLTTTRTELSGEGQEPNPRPKAS